jgi:hypothetical protein
MTRIMCVMALKSSEDTSRRVARMHLTCAQDGKIQGRIAYGWVRKGSERAIRELMSGSGSLIVWVCGIRAGRRAWPCWGVGVSERKPYKSDLSDERWALIEPVIAAWKAGHRSVSGHEGQYAMREIVNAILYQSRTSCQWGFLSTRPAAPRRGVLLLREVARRRHRPDHP